ncbi:MAG: protoporphyrinogen oxidase [candidate division Zixibacteria bacterium]|nr:protoporphyrinogen oxidase [candidate division Zixibacteria bacterium]
MSQLDVVIIGGGISGLSALHFLRRKNPELNIRLYESDSKPGGTIGTDYIDGYSFDHGPNGFLDREPLTLELCDQLGLTDLLERANEKAEKRFILRKGKLREVPISPPKFLSSDILSLRGKLRVMMEPFSPGLGDIPDESLYDFAKRHMGKEAADYLIQPMVSGIFGGLAERLSLKSCFPIMAEMEKEYGSLFKAMIKKAKKAKAEGKKSGGPGGPGGRLTSVRGGLYGIIERFMELYSDLVQLDTPVKSIIKEESNYLINFENSQNIRTKHIIIATPSYVAAQITKQLSENLSASFAKIEYAPIAVVCQGYQKSNVEHPLEGFGFLVPQKENKRILGSIWTSSIFSERAPKDHAQFRTMIGGDGDHESLQLSDEDLISKVESDLDSIIGIEAAPEITSIYRWKNGIPQYKIGHSDVMNRIETELNMFENIFITGNAYYGIGLNDCVKQSHAIAQKI